MKTIESALLDAAKDTNTPPSKFSRCDERHARDIIEKTKSIYVDGNSRVWWFKLKHVVMRRHFPDGGFRHLREFMPAGESMLWFLPEVHETSPLVYEVDADCITDIIGNSIGFDYYIVSKSFQWLIAETDADQLLFARGPVP